LDRLCVIGPHGEGDVAVAVAVLACGTRRIAVVTATGGTTGEGEDGRGRHRDHRARDVRTHGPPFDLSVVTESVGVSMSRSRACYADNCDMTYRQNEIAAGAPATDRHVRNHRRPAPSSGENRCASAGSKASVTRSPRRGG